MGIYRGPGVVNDGLVFGYDTGYPISDAGVATRFNQGRPATNTILSGATWFGDGGNQTVGSKGYTVITDENLKYNGYETVLWTPGTSRNVYFNGNADISTSDNSTVWTFSCYMRYEDQTPITSLGVYLYFPNSDGNAAGTITDCGNGWYRVSRTRTGTNSYIALAGFTTFVSNKKIYLSGPMLTKTSTEAPYIGRSVTRSDTASLIDLKRTLSLDVSNISFDSTGQPEFDGSNDTIAITSTTLGNGAWTIDAVIEADSHGYNVLSNSSGGPVTNAFGTNNNRIFYRHYNGSWQNREGTSTTVNLNTKYYLTWVNKAGATMDMYVNGVKDSVSGFSSTTTNGGPVNAIGRNWFSYFNGHIYLLKYYNKSLTDQQVLDNYKAYKNRFNI